MNEEIKSKVINILEKGGVSRTKGSRVVINGTPYPISYLSNVLNPYELSSVPELSILSSDKNAYKLLWHHVAGYFSDKEREYEREKDRIRVESIVKSNVGSLQDDGGKLLRDIESLIPIVIPSKKQHSKRTVMFNPKTGEVDTDTDPDIFFLIKNISEKEAIATGIVKFALLEFNPYMTESSYIAESSGYLVLNMYKVPPWRKVPFEGKAEIPPFIDKLIKHLFPDEEARKYVLSWICRAVLDRNQTYLSLVGARGTGKNILATIVGSLIGMEYTEVVGNSILDDKFNSPMKNNRLVVLDEIVANEQEQISKLKSFANNLIPLEEKGKDQQTVKNYNSMMILVNEINSLAISPQDRRFSLPEITGVSLTKVMSEEEISDWVASVEADDVFEDIVEFGNWVLQNGKYYMSLHKNNIPWKKKHYYEVARSNMAEWQIFLEEYITDKRVESITYTELNKEFKKRYRESVRFPVSTSTLVNFLKDFLYEGKLRLADIVKESGERIFVVNPDLLEYLQEKDPRDDNDDNDDSLDFDNYTGIFDL